MNLCRQKTLSEGQCQSLESVELEPQKPEQAGKPVPPQIPDGGKSNYCVYVLAAKNKIRYVGITTRKPIKKRLYQHLSLARKGTRNIYSLNWIRQCMAKNIPIVIRALRSHLTSSDAIALEMAVIKKYGTRLVNSHAGGFIGVAGLSPEAREKWNRSQAARIARNGGHKEHYRKLNEAGIAERWGTHRKTTWLKRDRLLRRLALMRAAKERKRLANPVEREPKLARWYPLEFGVRDKATGETAWIDLKSCRDAAKRIDVILKYYISNAKPN